MHPQRSSTKNYKCSAKLNNHQVVNFDSHSGADLKMLSYSAMFIPRKYIMNNLKYSQFNVAFDVNYNSL